MAQLHVALSTRADGRPTRHRTPRYSPRYSPRLFAEIIRRDHAPGHVWPGPSMARWRELMSTVRCGYEAECGACHVTLKRQRPELIPRRTKPRPYPNPHPPQPVIPSANITSSRPCFGEFHVIPAIYRRISRHPGHVFVHSGLRSQRHSSYHPTDAHNNRLSILAELKEARYRRDIAEMCPR